jgi:hypothetical protein
VKNKGSIAKGTNPLIRKELDSGSSDEEMQPISYDLFDDGMSIAISLCLFLLLVFV